MRKNTTSGADTSKVIRIELDDNYGFHVTDEFVDEAIAQSPDDGPHSFASAVIAEFLNRTNITVN